MKKTTTIEAFLEGKRVFSEQGRIGGYPNKIRGPLGHKLDEIQVHATVTSAEELRELVMVLHYSLACFEVGKVL